MRIPPHPNPLPPGEGTFSPQQWLCKGLLMERGFFTSAQGMRKFMLRNALDRLHAKIGARQQREPKYPAVEP